MRKKYFLIVLLVSLFLGGRTPERATAASVCEHGRILASAAEKSENLAGVYMDYDNIDAEGNWEEEKEEIEDKAIPLAELPSRKASRGFSWRGILLAFLALVILCIGIWAASKSKKEKTDWK